MVGAAIYCGYHGLDSRVAWVAGSVAFAAFCALVRAHRRAAARAAQARAVAAACRAGLARMARDWTHIPPVRITRATSGRAATAGDLDILGDISLFRLLDVTTPALGGERLLEWLLGDPADLPTIMSRQASVAALRARPDVLVESAVVGRHGPYMRSATSPRAVHAFVDWCAQPSGSETHWTRQSRIAAGCSVLIVALIAWRTEAAVPFIIALVAVQLLLAARARKHLTSSLAGLGSLLPQLRGLDASMQLIAREDDVAGAFGEVQQALRRQGASNSLGALDTILVWNDVRLTPMAHFPLNSLFGADVHIAAALVRWRARSGIHVADWVDRTSSAQALAALATLAFENPRWAMPNVHDGADAPAFVGDAVTHPLLSPSVAVPNPVRIESSSTLLALSGSNMAGKTTYLRAIGLNAVLAFAGGPVSATGLTARLARVRTSVRIEDDLGAGVSLFLAEVSQLRDIVRDSEVPSAPPVLFLFDEILHGTNAADRRHASQVVLRKLLAAGGFGVLTTHDADLVTDLFDASVMTQAQRVQQGHFRETVQRDGEAVRMSFDYVLRPGPTTSANARVILEMMGLEGAPG